MAHSPEVNKIRKKYFVKGETRGKIAKGCRRSWDTVNRIVNMGRSDIENRGKRRERKSSVMTDSVIKAITDIFDYEEAAGIKKKQRHTAYQIYKELSENGVYQGSRRTMEKGVSKIRAEKKLSSKPSYLPLEFPLGSELQVDHGEVEIEIDGEIVKGYLFVGSVPGQVLRYCQAFPTKASESWGEFHERLFEFFGGVFPRLTYDNDSVLVKKIIGKERKQTTFSISLEEHYGFESHFCNVRSGNEKGAVENGVGYCRRRFFAGRPAFNSWGSLNIFLNDCCLKDIKEGTHYKTKEKLSGIFSKLQKKLRPSPVKKSWCRWVECRVDKCQLVTVDNHQYSVPEKFVGCKIRVALTWEKVELTKDGETVVVHDRLYGAEDGLILDHYLEQLKRKPGAFPYAKASKRAQIDPEFLEMRSRLSDKYGNNKANRQFVDLLLLQRHWSQKELVQGVQKALDLGAIDVSAVEVILRQKELSYPKSQEEMKHLMPVSSMKWDFNLSSYKELCAEVAQ